MNMNKRSVAAVAAVLSTAVVFTTVITPVEAKAKRVTGKVLAVGSTALQPLVERAAMMYKATHKGVDVQVQGGGSGTGLKNVAAGTADIGNSDVFANEKLDADKAKGLVDHKVCVVGFATVVNPNIAKKVKELKKDELIKIFTGKVTNWKQVGGSDEKIIVINRPSSSGTRAVFKKYALDGADEATGKAMTEDSSGAVEKTIAETKGAIGYLALPYLDTKGSKSKVKTVAIDGVTPTIANIKTGKYKVWAYEHMYTKGAAKGAVADFLKYMQSTTVSKSVVKKLNYIPISDMKVKRDN